jgi:hypothetical protein
VVSGAIVIQDSEGREQRVESGFAFEIEAGGDAWVAGSDPCTALDFIPLEPPLGARQGGADDRPRALRSAPGPQRLSNSPDSLLASSRYA